MQCIVLRIAGSGETVSPASGRTRETQDTLVQAVQFLPFLDGLYSFGFRFWRSGLKLRLDGLGCHPGTVPSSRLQVRRLAR